MRALGRCAERLAGGSSIAVRYGLGIDVSPFDLLIFIRASSLNTLWPSDRMWTSKAFRRSWRLAAMMYGDLAVGVLSAVPWLESSRRVRHAELLQRDFFPERLPNIVLLDNDAGFARATKGETRVYESPGDMLIANVSQEFCTVCVSIHICNTRAIVVIGPTDDKCFVACSSLSA